jgi:hypothetical protein
VYALSSRFMLDGHDLYGHMVAAQPPGLYIAGAGILAVHDGLEWLRMAVGVVQLAGGVVAGVVAYRLSGSAWAAAAAPALVLLTPWAVHEHGALTPEPFAPPLLLGGALLAARPGRSSVAGGALAALAVGFKLPFIIPAALIALAAADRRRALLGVAAVLVVGGALALLVFGTGVWEDAVLAQLGTGRRGLRALAGFWAQAGWNAAALLALAAVAVVRARETLDPRLLRTAVAAAFGLGLTFLTNWKEGTGLNVFAPIEAGLVPLALAGAVLLVRTSGRRGVVLVGLAAVFTLVQSASLLVSPRTDRPFLYPTSQRGSWGRADSGDIVRRLVAQARRCPPGAKYAGSPFIAFLAHRPVPDAQPDTFLSTRSPRLAPVARRIAADGPRCP